MVNSTFDRPRQNKANSGGAANRAKQTQFKTSRARTPNPRRVDYAKQSQFGGVADHAKQSQSAADGIAHHSTVPSFQYSIPMPFVQNGPNHRQDADATIPATPKDWRAVYRRVTWYHVSFLCKEIV